MLIILDRDGVINFDSEFYIKSPEEWIPIPGSLEAIAKLKQAGFKIVIATNQSGIGRGFYTHEILAEIHQKMNNLLADLGVSIDGIFYCPHHPDDHCSCRKPEPGLLYQIAEKMNIDLTKSLVVGDSYRDIQAAQAVKAKPILVLTGNGKNAFLKHPELQEINVYQDLSDFVNSFLAFQK